MKGIVETTALAGVEVKRVTIEVDARKGEKNYFSIIGLADNAVREAKDRVYSALRHLGVSLPQRILVNLAPAALPKEGSSYDLPIAVALLSTLQVVPPQSVADTLFLGELSLSGEIRPFQSLLAHLLGAVEGGARRLFVPPIVVPEGLNSHRTHLFAAESLSELVAMLRGEKELRPLTSAAPTPRIERVSLDEIKGQARAKRGLQVALAGGHNILLSGPPGCGKSMLAQSARSLLPPLRGDRLLETARIHSIAGHPVEGLLGGEPPFRAPHHTTSDAALIGSTRGRFPKPGETSLANNGILFLDEFPEFSRRTLEALRVPLEEGTVRVCRTQLQFELPARFTLFAAMNPCPCGRALDGDATCRCSEAAKERYIRKLSQPLLERIDIRLTLKREPVVDFTKQSRVEGRTPKNEHREAQQSIIAARNRQLERQGYLNRWATSGGITDKAHLDAEVRQLLNSTAERYKLSHRSVVRALRLSRTIADLEESEQIGSEHLIEALSLGGFY